MGKDRDPSRRRQVAGSVKELIGKLIGDKQIEDEGAREKSGQAGTPGPAHAPIPDPDKPV
ncbi:CsbD family protein [Aureimonas sp. AU20]|uniref:CsbD family protein n=1 Tax=Aureimonas sp. AU20 TaxID=1349819 RepID=UPI00071FF8F4|nr:CsbD family protein [Aureimonas sp. AU20]ALN71839.1 hypothetical protein M673_03880 [Aureimonas sp. AU20]